MIFGPQKSDGEAGDGREHVGGGEEVVAEQEESNDNTDSLADVQQGVLDLGILGQLMELRLRPVKTK